VDRVEPKDNIVVLSGSKNQGRQTSPRGHIGKRDRYLQLIDEDRDRVELIIFTLSLHGG
jgi:hypothetical protein